AEDGIRDDLVTGVQTCALPISPTRPVTINNGYVMRAWYDIVMQDLGRKADEGGIRESQKAIDHLIQRERDRGVAADRIVLAGFRSEERRVGKEGSHQWGGGQQK